MTPAEALLLGWALFAALIGLVWLTLPRRP